MTTNSSRATRAWRYAATFLFTCIFMCESAQALNIKKEEFVVVSPDQYWEWTLGGSIGLPYFLGLEAEISYYHETNLHPYFKLAASTSELISSGAASAGVAIVSEQYVHGLDIGISQVNDDVNNVGNVYSGTRIAYQIREKPSNTAHYGSKFFIGVDYLPHSQVNNKLLGFLGTVIYFDFHPRP